jgi:SAM-dependent methyltransferase
MTPPSEHDLAAACLVSPAAERNRGPILDVLRRTLPASGIVLEIAAGTGQHAVHFSRALPMLTWQPSDPDARARASIAAWSSREALPNLQPPIELDVRAQPWHVSRADAIVCINMIHISPWTATTGLFSGAASVLGEGGIVYLYGPYKLDGRHTAPSNEAFDRSLRAQDPQWGVRDLADVAKVAAAEGFDFVETIEMPANNLSVTFRKRNDPTPHHA